MLSSQKLYAILSVVIILAVVEMGAVVFLANESAQNKAAQQQSGKQLELATVAADSNGIINSLLLSVDRVTAQAALDLKLTGLNGSACREALNRGLQVENLIIDMVTTDMQGAILAAEPAQYHHLEGMLLADQEPIMRMIASQQAVISPLMLMVEGYHAVFVGYPVFDAEGRMNGTVLALFRPDEMAGIAYAMLAQPRGLGMMVMQGDGVILFDPDPAQIGKDTFTDPMFNDFPQIKRVAYKMVNESTGLDTYSFTTPGSSAVVSKTVVWCTSYLLQANWTVAINRAA